LRISHSFTYFYYFNAQEAERRNFMSAIIHVMGRVTKDPAMQQGRNNGTEYISLDLATSQRSQNAQNNPENQYEPIFYQCYLNKFLAERLLKAGVKKGTCLYIYGELEIHPFIYNQGQRAGQTGAGAKINVRDWQFCLSNKPENESGANPTGGNQNPVPQGGEYQNPAGGAQGGAYLSGYNPAGNGNYAGNGTSARGNYPNSGSSAGGSYPANASAQNGSNGNQTYQQQTGNPPYGQAMQGTFARDGFTNVPEGMAAQLPFTA
jgi:single-stranded DNA-binding protein